MAETKPLGLHRIFRKVLVMAQLFGVFPVCGVLQKSEWFLRFSWKSKRTVYSVVVLAMIAFVTLTSALYMIDSKPELWKWTLLSFYANNFITNALFLHLSATWPTLMLFWGKIQRLTKFSFSRRMERKFYLITAFIMGCALVEHVLSEYNAAMRLMSRNEDYLKALTKLDNPGLLLYIPYSPALGVLSKVTNILATFSWNFIDLFIMLMSVAMVDLFEQFTAKVSSVPYEEMTKSFWKKARENHSRLCDLHEETENAISNITLLSFANNMYFILIQLYLSISLRGVSFVFSLAMLTFRTLCLCLLAAQVYEESKRPLDYLTHLPSRFYDEEVERLMEQIHNRTVAITGNKFFIVTRGLIFRIAATVVTYELFLFQFNVKADQ